MEFSETFIQQVWEKAIVFAPETESEWRKDIYFSFIKRKHFNNFESDYGWGIDKISPEGGEEIDNYRPMQWRNIKSAVKKTQQQNVFVTA